MNIQPPSDLPSIHHDSWDRLSSYAVRTGRTLTAKLGWGSEGVVYATDAKTAIKSYRHRSLYENERNVYFRLRDRAVNSVLQFAVPRLIANDDELLALEMSIVSPPFILDFAGAYLDRPSPFSDEELQEWQAEKAELFGKRWPEVRRAYYAFQSFGILLNDLKLGNVSFPDDDEEE
ncbi:MAG TPA: hypothetical protein VEI07_16295 [Planctomycetaceae bacterium]|nr:hypothetical protein [Planctomycetaceae bacterium]